MQQHNSPKSNNLVEIRCTGLYFDVRTQEYRTCNKVLGKVQKDADYQIKCTKCGTMNEREKST